SGVPALHAKRPARWKNRRAGRGPGKGMLVSGRRRRAYPPRAIKPGSVAVVVAAGRRGLAVITAVALVIITPLRVALILRVADHVAADRAQTRADGRAFQTATALVADDAARRRSAQRAQHRARLRVRARGAGGNA